MTEKELEKKRLADEKKAAKAEAKALKQAAKAEAKANKEAEKAAALKEEQDGGEAAETQDVAKEITTDNSENANE